MNKFGPQGISPDKLLMCSNMVSAGLLVAQLFMNQQDPTMQALQGIMKQLEAIQKQLEQIDKKIDELSNLVLVGFERTLQNQQYMQLQIEDFSKAVLANIADQQQREATREYLRYVAGDVELYNRSLMCTSTLPSDKIDGNGCMKALAEDISKKTIFTPEYRNTTPRILNNIWVNQMLSVKVGDGDRQSLELAELSSPVYFMSHPKAFRSVIARNHEAVAAFAGYTLGIPHPSIVPNPEVLAIKLRTLVAAADRSPEFSKREASPLTDQALERLEEVETFVTTTVAEKTTMQKLVMQLGADLSAYENVVTTSIAEAMKASRDTLRKRFLDANLDPCPDTNKGWKKIASPINADSLVPSPFWVAQDMGLGKVQMCYQALKAVTYKEAPGYYKFPYRVKFYFQPTSALDPLRINEFERAGGLTIGGDKAIAIRSRVITSNFGYTTYNNKTEDLIYGAWVGSDHFISEIFECRTSATGEQPCKGTNSDKVFQRFVGDSTDDMNDRQQKTALDFVNSLILAQLKPVVRARSHIWDPTNLQFEARGTPGVLLNQDIQTSDRIAAAMRQYSKTYLFAQDLLLIGFYHDARVSACSSALGPFAPIHVTDAITEAAMKSRPGSTARSLTSQLTSVLDSCLAKGISDELVALKARLVELRNNQLAN